MASRPSRRRAVVCITVELPGELPRIRVWRGPSVPAIKKAARETYGPKAKLQFGAVLWNFYWGAH